MKRPGKRFLRAVAILACAPPLLWLGVLALLPMGWARDRVVVALAASTRQDVRLAKVRLLPWGGAELTGLEIASPANPADPWLNADAVRIDVGLGDLVRGRIRATACRASGITLRIHRDASGRMEAEEMFRHGAKADPAEASRVAARGDDAEVSLTLEGGRVEVIDDPSGTRLDLADVNARASFNQEAIEVSDLTGTLNGGTFSASARADRAGTRAIEARLQAQNVQLGVGMKSLAYLIPLLQPGGKTPHARGTLAIDADLKARGGSSAELARTLTAGGTVTLDDLNLDDSRVLDEVQSLLPVPTRGKLGSLKGHFAIADRRVSTADTVLKVAEVPIDLSGWSDFDGRLDYLVKCEKLGKAVGKLASRLPTEARDFLSDLTKDDIANLGDVRVFGTIDHPQVKAANGAFATKPPPPRKPGPAGVAARKPSARKPALSPSDRAKLKEAANRLLDRAIR